MQDSVDIDPVAAAAGEYFARQLAEPAPLLAWRELGYVANVEWQFQT